MKNTKLLGCYSTLIRQFLDAGYIPTFFNQPVSAQQQILIRHDIDFDCALAYQLSEVENKLGIKGTYFFLLRSDSYNLLSPENEALVKSIRDAGHQVSLHFDPVIYSDFREGFHLERTIFERFFGIKIGIISLHRPTEFFQNYDEAIDGVEHTYQSKFFKRIKYISDSQGSFRFGHPLKSEAFLNRQTIHLLTHPIWWVMNGSDSAQIVDSFVQQKRELFVQHAGRNCIPYATYIKRQQELFPK